ncbi:hypothetical protein V8C35DRAFT_50205 [Trichoderma chlorosporum]
MVTAYSATAVLAKRAWHSRSMVLTEQRAFGSVEPSRDDTSYKLLSKGAARHTRSVLGRSLFLCPCLGIRLRDTKNCSLGLTRCIWQQVENADHEVCREDGEAKQIAYSLASHRIESHCIVLIALCRELCLAQRRLFRGLACRGLFVSSVETLLCPLDAIVASECKSSRPSLPTSTASWGDQTHRRPSAAHVFRKKKKKKKKKKKTLSQSNKR